MDLILRNHIYSTIIMLTLQNYEHNCILLNIVFVNFSTNMTE